MLRNDITNNDKVFNNNEKYETSRLTWKIQKPNKQLQLLHDYWVKRFI